MAKAASELIQIVRNITGRVDATDPLFTDSIMLQYIQDFIQLQSTQDIRLFQNRTWYEFTYGPTDADPLPVVLQNLPLINGNIGASFIGPEAYADGFVVFWYESPAEFYAIWPETQTYTPQRPTYVLYYNNELTFRGPPDRDYLIKIAAYQVEVQVDTVDGLSLDYMYRYICYGTALDIFSDFGEMDRWRDIYPAYQRYRAFVVGRTFSQLQNQRPEPQF